VRHAVTPVHGLKRKHVDTGLSDHRRIEATCRSLTMIAPPPGWSRRCALIGHAAELPRAKPLMLPRATELDLEQAMLPRDAFFAAKETVAVGRAFGRICGRTDHSLPAGQPDDHPGERIATQLLDYRRSGLAAGMQLPDPADPSLDTIRGVTENASDH
jgi:arginine decarboxylase